MPPGRNRRTPMRHRRIGYRGLSSPDGFGYVEAKKLDEECGRERRVVVVSSGGELATSENLKAHVLGPRLNVDDGVEPETPTMCAAGGLATPLAISRCARARLTCDTARPTTPRQLIRAPLLLFERARAKGELFMRVSVACAQSRTRPSAGVHAMLRHVSSTPQCARVAQHHKHAFVQKKSNTIAWRCAVHGWHARRALTGSSAKSYRSRAASDSKSSGQPASAQAVSLMPTEVLMLQGIGRAANAKAIRALAASFDAGARCHESEETEASELLLSTCIYTERQGAGPTRGMEVVASRRDVNSYLFEATTMTLNGAGK
eukprot:6214776-Pleurochrysis_carterae.AAC.5